MISKNCPLEGRDKFMVVMDGECSSWGLQVENKDPCYKCSFWNVAGMFERSGLPYELKFMYNRKEMKLKEDKTNDT